jgi:hypothetical protein
VKWLTADWPVASIVVTLSLLVCGNDITLAAALSYPIVGTGQTKCYDNFGEIASPKPGQPFYGQDGSFQGRAAAYIPSDDGKTVLDKVTGLTWQRSPDCNGDGTIDSKDKLTLAGAEALAARLNSTKFGGFSDWRVPTIKELYSLFTATGTDPRPTDTDTAGLTPFIDRRAFEFAYGDMAAGERIIDSQFASCTRYGGKSPRGGEKLFGVNFADGRIKGYDLTMPGGMEKKFFVLCVRGNSDYGRNDFRDNGNGTVTDRATGLMWSKTDSGKGMNWQDALAWVQKKNAEKYLGHNDWRMPGVKELQGIVDYSRSPDTTNSPAIDPLFHCTQITNEAGKADYPFYWSATTHVGPRGGAAAMYVAFGRAGGWLPARMLAGDQSPAAQASEYRFVDVHGAGAQRSDPKTGNPDEFPHGRGPQGDAIHIYNYVRLVRGGLKGNGE